MPLFAAVVPTLESVAERVQSIDSNVDTIIRNIEKFQTLQGLLIFSVIALMSLAVIALVVGISWANAAGRLNGADQRASELSRLLQTVETSIAAKSAEAEKAKIGLVAAERSFLQKLRESEQSSAQRIAAIERELLEATTLGKARSRDVELEDGFAVRIFFPELNKPDWHAAEAMKKAAVALQDGHFNAREVTDSENGDRPNRKGVKA